MSKLDIPEAALNEILCSFREIELSKGKSLIKKGQPVRAYYFIVSGGLRIFFKMDEREITAWLAFEDDFFTELQSLKSGKPSRFEIQAIAETVLYTIDARTMQRLYDKFPAWQHFGRLVWEDAFLKVVNGLLSHQTLSAKERYLAMLEQSDLLQKVPLKQLASYLGITESSLSRIRRHIN